MQSLKLRSLLEGFSSQKKEWPKEEKKAALEAIGRYNEYGNHLRREHNLMEIAHTLSNITEAAEKFTLSETEGSFDSATVKKNILELRKISDQFGKLAQEAHVTQQRMEALYEDGGHILNRYFEIKDLDEGVAAAVSKIKVS
jgi:division protein CdvB (Snf7/Vps24/ESCRT-III family)